MGVRDEAERLVRNSWREVRAEDITFMAGSIAYHAFVSMLPLLVFLLVVLSAVGNEAFTAELVEVTEQFLTPYARDLLVESLDVTSARTGVSLLGGVTLLWGISKIFRSLDVAFSRIYDSPRQKTVLDEVENALVVLFGLVVAVLSFLAAGAVLSLFPDLPYLPVLNPLVLLVGLGVAFFPIYYVFPDVDVTPREVLPGVVVAALGWTALEAVFQAYVSFAGRYEAAYGTLGSAFILLIWLYFSGLILLLGAVVNAVLAGRTGDRNSLDEGVAERERWRQAREEGGETERSTEADGGGAATDREALDRSGQELGRAYERLDGDRQRLEHRIERLEAENDRLERENDRLERENDALALRLRRQRRSGRERVRRWLFGDRE
jgi:membrane protein